MISSRLNRIFPILIGLVLFVLPFSSNYRYGTLDKLIRSDGLGYYSYLPALFIHQDPEYDFIEKYTEDIRFDYFVNTIKGERVIKYPVGMAILWAPFFFLAHFLSLLFGIDANGYSILYQLSLLLANAFYAGLTAWFLKKSAGILGIKSSYTYIGIIFLFFGTHTLNYYYFDAFLSHTYSLSLFSAWIFIILKLREHPKTNYFVYLGLLLGLITIVRPTNILILLWTPVLFNNWNEFKSALLLVNIKRLFLGFVSLGFMIFLQLLAWKWQSGNWIVYSYANEGFDFSNPHIIATLFGFSNGFFPYAPLWIIGFIIIISSIRFQKWKPLMFLFALFVSTYLFSCWHAYNYACCLGYRPFIEYQAFMLIPALQGFSSYRWQKGLSKAFLLAGVASIIFSFTLCYQYRHSILSWCNMDFRSYVDVWMKTDMDYKFYLWPKVEYEKKAEDLSLVVHLPKKQFTSHEKAMDYFKISPADSVKLSTQSIARIDYRLRMSKRDESKFVIRQYAGDSLLKDNRFFLKADALRKDSFFYAWYDFALYGPEVDKLEFAFADKSPGNEIYFSNVLLKIYTPEKRYRY